MTVSYIIFGGGVLEPPGTALYERYPLMRDWSDQVEQWSGLSMEQLWQAKLTPRDDADHASKSELRHIAEVRQALLALGIADILAEQGIRPDLLGGISLGWMISACMAGALTREELFAMLRFNSRQPMAAPGEPDRAVAVALLDVDADLDWYCGPDRPGVYFASDVGGRFADGKHQVCMFSGYVDALRELAAEAPAGQVNVYTALGGGHTPLQKYYASLVQPYLDKIPFRKPHTPVVSALLEGRAITTVEEVRAEFSANMVTPAYLEYVKNSLAERGTELMLVLGVSAPVAMFTWPCPALCVSSPEEIEQAAATVFDMGIELKFT